MIPIKQTKIWPESGNCFSACVASLLHLPIDDVPVFENDPGQEGSWVDKWQEWLRPRNLNFVCLKAGYNYTRGYAIVSKSGAGHDGEPHAFIVRDGQPVFDPHPRVQDAKDMLSDWDYWYILVPLDPST